MSEIEFAGKRTATLWAHRSLEIMNRRDNRKIDAVIKEDERLGKGYSRNKEKTAVYMHLTEG